MKKLYLLTFALVLGGCQTTSVATQATKVQTPTSFEWRGYKIDAKCSRSLIKVQTLEAQGFVPRPVRTKAERSELLRYLSASEFLRLNKSCWTAQPPDQPNVDWDHISSGGALSVLKAASAKLPDGIDRKDGLAVDLFQDMILRGYSRDEAASVVGTALWREHLAWRHYSKAKS